MKKRIFIFLCILACLVGTIAGCKKEEIIPVTIPDTVIENTPSELPDEKTSEVTSVAKQPLEEDAVMKEHTEDPITEDYPHWSKLHDYHLDQQDLASDGEFKNLSVQPGNLPDELYITWFSKSGFTGNVHFESEESRNISAKASTRPSTAVQGYYRNSALIQNLESNTIYTYYLQNGKNKSPLYTFQTGNLESNDFVFTIAGDPEIGLGDVEDYDGQRSIWRVVLNRMKTQIPESSFLLTMGDQIAKSDSSDNYDYFLDNSVLYSTPLVPVMGNHDAGSGFFAEHYSLPNLSSWCQSQGNDGDYWFTRGNVLFMVINTETTMDIEDHEYFVAEAIEQNPDAKWRVVIGHSSPATVIERYQGIREYVQDVYADIERDYNIDLFLGGHDHVYTRSFFLDDDSEPYEGQTLQYEFHNPEHAIYVIFNGSTTSLLRDPDPGYPWSALSVQNGVPQLSKAHVTENSFTITTYDADSWETIDSFTIYKE